MREVERLTGRSGTTRFVLHDDEDNQYTTFRTAIGEHAQRFTGKRARIEFHEEDRKGFHNVYLDSISPSAEPDEESRDAAAPSPAARQPDESAWDTAVEAAPWILGTREPQEAVPPEELYERLHPFKELVAEDIRDSGGEGEQAADR